MSLPKSKPPSGKVQVFISSPFRDMHAERDHLVTVVFPELRERVERLGLEFFDVDLRWGVPDKDVNGETTNSWEYCRQWIDRVEPLFACILGQRYGWVPDVTDFKDEADQTRQRSEPRSITDLEVRHAVLNDRRKRRSYFYLRTTPVPVAPPDAPAELREIHDEFVDSPERLEKLETLKTEIRGCGRPVRNYEGRWTGRGFVDLDAFGRLVLDDLWSGVLRDPRYVSKEVWRQALGADPDGDPRYTEESQPVPPELAEKIVALAKPPPVSPLDAERQQMEAFAASRLKWFQGRTDQLKTLTAFVHATDEHASRLAVIAAVPGQGKSALLAKLSTLIPQPSIFAVTHFIGATERSASAMELVKRLLDELDRSDIEWPEERSDEEPKRDFNSLCARLSKRLGDYAGSRRIVLLIDALNQLSDGHDLLWLPQQFGPGVRVVVSCVDDPGAKEGSPEQRVLQALDHRRAGLLWIPLGPLTPEDVRTVVIDYLREYCKELDAPQVDALCALPQAHNPLYLLVMLGELRTLGGNDLNRKVPALIAMLPQAHPNTVSLFKWVLQRLEVFGAEEVKYWCRYLALGRVGMASRELADLLQRKLGEATVPKALLIERGLRRYLQPRGGQLDFFHGQLRQAVTEKYGAANDAPLHHEIAEYFTACARGNDPRKTWETESVRGFSECVYHFTQAGNYDEARQLLGNFPFLLHKTRVGLLESVFEDYESFRHTAPANDVHELESHSTFFREKAHILRRGNAEWPPHKILLQLVVEHADDSPLTLGAEQWLAEGRCDWTWLRRNRRVPHAQTNPCLAVLEGHSEGVNGALVLTDGRILSWSADKALRLWDSQSGKCLAILEGHSQSVCGAFVLSDGRILSWSDDTTLRLWENRSGRCLAILDGHSGRVCGAIVLSRGRILSWTTAFRSKSHPLHIWDDRSGKLLAILEGHTDEVEGALMLPDGRLLSWSRDMTLRIWDDRSGKCLAILEGHSSFIDDARVLPDGRILSWARIDYHYPGRDCSLRLWDSQSGKCLASLVGHSSSVNGAQVLPDGRILSWSVDRSLRLWDSRSGKCLAILEGHSGPVRGAHLLSDGRILSWANDETLRIWDIRSGTCVAVFIAKVRAAIVKNNRNSRSRNCLAVLEGHSGSVDGAFVLPDGRILSWAADHTLRLWDGRLGIGLAILEGHSAEPSGALVLQDGRILSWARDHTLRVWDDRSEKSCAVRNERLGKVKGTTILPDGGILSWAEEDHFLRLWDSRSGIRHAILEGHTAKVGGALVLSDGRILSWAVGHEDPTLRIWDSRSGKCLTSLKGHFDSVRGALVLSNGRILSWAGILGDHTLRIWDSRSGTCLAVLDGHSDQVNGALALPNGRILSWAMDETLRIWDSQSGECHAVLKGHSNWVDGALVLPDGRILSWVGYKHPSQDHSLRIWDSQSGECLAVLNGHTDNIHGALVLSDGRILSWSADKTLSLWENRSGQRLAVLGGHTDDVRGALVLPDDRILSWSDDKTLRSWDTNGSRIAVQSIDDGLRMFPEFRLAYGGKDKNQSCCLWSAKTNAGRLRHFGEKFEAGFLWHGDTRCIARHLLPDGQAILTQDNGEVCFLQLHQGNRPISIGELERMGLGDPPPAS